MPLNNIAFDDVRAFIQIHFKFYILTINILLQLARLYTLPKCIDIVNGNIAKEFFKTRKI